MEKIKKQIPRYSIMTNRIPVDLIDALDWLAGLPQFGSRSEVIRQALRVFIDIQEDKLQKKRNENRILP